MSETTVGTIETLLEGVLAETEDAESRFKIRTALSLLSVVEEREQVTRKALAEADLGADVREDLRELGYLGR